MTNTPFFHNSNEALANYLRIHRRNAGLNQKEIGRFIGYDDETAIRKHERFQTIPPFLIALGYEAIFRVPTSELFRGVAQTVAIGVEARIADFARELREGAHGQYPPEMIARKLDWLREREARPSAQR